MINITEKEFSQLADYIKKHYGIYLKKEKMALVTGRLQNVLIEKGFQNFTDYYNHILSDKSGTEVTTLVDKITTNHTFFMREQDHFTYFKDKVLPYLKTKIKDKDLRVWCAGCSTGEEPYTLAMIIDEFFGKEKSLWDTKILATDISNRVLEIAKGGIYSSDGIGMIPAQWKLNYFKKIDNENNIITDQIKKEIIFRKFNLMEENFPFKRKFHVIYCRNVMIYFDTQTKCKLINKFYDSLEYGGYLFIGHSESINRDDASFKYVMPSVYRKV